MKQLISVAKGESLADLILANAKVVNTFNGEIESANVAVYDGLVAGVGDYQQAKTIIDLKGKYIAPGLINGHVHLESSMLDVGQYARAVVPHGTSAIVTDLHEIANVCGIEGIKYVLDYARRLPFDLFLMAPSCVPATHLETAGANIGPDDIKRILRFKECIGLGEVMNYPGVLFGDDGMLSKIELAKGKIIDGHAPGVSGKNLNAYIGTGIHSDHESVALAEAAEKLRRGMHVMIREGSSEKNLEALLPLVTDKTYSRCLFVVDDRHAEDILHDGDIDAVVRKAIKLGLDPVRAIQMATINTANYFRLDKLGAVAPGYYANFIILNNLADFKVKSVYYQGRLVAENGQALFDLPKAPDNQLSRTVNIKPITIDALKLKAKGETSLAIEVVPGQIITRKKSVKVAVKEGFVRPDTSRDILKAVVVERHNATGNIGLGLVTGFGLKKGALASSTAHDSHNIVVVGASDEDIYAAIKDLERIQGGIVVAAGGKVLGSLATPIAGLLSEEPLEQVVSGLTKMGNYAQELGCTLPAPFATLSFLALPVIPELRLTDLGLVDVNEFKIIA
ncbi:MAG: adenine deaminase [Chloroflexi bacterium RBG_13_51_18]|nr:MAG: adenine deaminase [Chloroflexi bacterium RBG_13_51_18]